MKFSTTTKFLLVALVSDGLALPSPDISTSNLAARSGYSICCTGKASNLCHTCSCNAAGTVLGCLWDAEHARVIDNENMDIICRYKDLGNCKCYGPGELRSIFNLPCAGK